MVALGEQARGGDGVAPEGGHQRVGHGAHAAPAPPRRLRVGRDADRAGHVGGPTVAGLHEPVVMAGREEEDGLAVRRLDHGLDVAHDQRAPRHATQVDRFQMREQPGKNLPAFRGHAIGETARPYQTSSDAVTA